MQRKNHSFSLLFIVESPKTEDWGQAETDTIARGGAWSCLSQVSVFLGPAAVNGGCAELTQALLFTLKWPFLLHLPHSFTLNSGKVSSSGIQSCTEGNENSEPFVFSRTKECAQKQPQQFRLQGIHIYKQTCTYISSHQNFVLDGF